MECKQLTSKLFLHGIYTYRCNERPSSLNEQAMHISYMISEVRDQGGSVIEATDEGEQMWVDEMLDKSKLGERFRRVHAGLLQQRR